MNTPTVEVLPSLPSMRAAFAAGLIPRRRPKVAAIPDHAVAVHGLRHDSPRYADYLRVCGFDRAPHVPPTWLHVLTFPLHIHLLTHPESSIRLVGSVHVTNRMTLVRPVLPSETLDAQVHLANLRPHRRGALVDLVGRIDSGGETVWHGVSTYLAQGMEVPGEVIDVAREEFTSVPVATIWNLPRHLGKDYRRVSGDPNPIHTSRIAAKLFGFPKPIIHGMWTHARVLAQMQKELPETYTVQATFTKPIGLPARVGFTPHQDTDVIRGAVTTPDGSKPHVLVTIEK